VTDLLYGLDAADRERVAALRAERRFFWLDVSLSETSREDLVDALGIPERVLGALWRTRDGFSSRAFHADGESVVFALRCYVELEPEKEQDGYRLRPIEVHVLLTSDYLLTLHHERVSLPAVLAPDLPPGRSKQYVVYSVLDAMLATTSDALEEVDVRLDALGAAWTEGDGGGLPRATLRQAGARLATMRRWVRNEQDVFERVGLEIGALREFGASEASYFDRLEDQVNRLLTSIDAAANAMGMVLDLQLNERAYVISIIATIFVPLTFITGFFGMNFGWMVDRIDSPVAFWLLGFTVPIATAALAWRFLARQILGLRAGHRRAT
jgi:magnesium transporter